MNSTDQDQIRTPLADFTVNAGNRYVNRTQTVFFSYVTELHVHLKEAFNGFSLVISNCVF